MDDTNDICGTIRRETVRAILERAQGEMFKNAGSDQPAEDHVAPEGVTEELDVAYINRQGVPLAMDIIGPADTKGVELPVVITIHGGGLVMGDRTITRAYARQLALRGYLVFSIEYRLAPRANVCEQLDDVCAGMDLVGRRLVDFDVDFGRVFLTAESAGAYLAIYVAAMKTSTKLQKAIGYEPTRMQFRALGLFSGMFYTNKPDLIGALFAEQFYGDKRADEEFLRYMDPEHHEIVSNLPPCYFITSRGDFLNSYTIEYHRALRDAGKQTHLLFFGDDDLGHAFATIRPELEESQRAIDKMCAWFETQAENARYRGGAPEEAERLDALRGRISSGEIRHQKSWQFIRELNSATEAQLDKVALRDVGRTYTYRQLFRAQDRFAEVFSALGITGKEGARVGVAANNAAQPLIAYYALNMVGASVSMILDTDILVKSWIKRAIKTEGITDLIVPDTSIDAKVLRELVSLKKSAGLRHVIVLHVSKGRAFSTPFEEQWAEQNWREIKKVKGVLLMPRLLREHAATPIAYASADNDEAAVIVHTSGTTKAVHKPIPLSDYGLNDAALRFFDNEAFAPLFGKAVTTMSVPPFSSYGMVDMVHLPLALGCTIAIPDGILGPPGLSRGGAGDIRFLADEGVSVLFAFPYMLEEWGGDESLEGVDLSELSVVVFGGASVSNDQLKRAKKTLRRFGAHPVIINGYGISECGAAAIMHVFDGKGKKKDHSEIGVPLKGVQVLVQDEDTKAFYRLEDGARMGVLHIASESNSCGRLGDRVFFEPVEVEGTSYLCTNDLVQVNESGTLTYVGRANRYFIDEKGKRFEAGVVEAALQDQPGIDACAVVPVFDRIGTHDTVPKLYVQPARGSRRRETVRKALVNVYVRDDMARDNDLPSFCVISDKLPVNEAGKVDVTRVMLEPPEGEAYQVAGVDAGGKLSDVRLVKARVATTPDELANMEGVSKKLRRERRALARNFMRVHGLDSIMATLALADAGGTADGGSKNGTYGIGQGPLALPLLCQIMQATGLQGGMNMKKRKKGMPKMPQMPPMGQMPMMPMMPPAPQGGKKPKKPKKGPKDAPMGFMPMMPMGPAPKKPKKAKKGPKPPKGFMPPIPMMPMAPAPKKAKKGPKQPMPMIPMMLMAAAPKKPKKGPKQPMGFMPMMPMAQMMPPQGPAPRPRRRPRRGRRH